MTPRTDIRTAAAPPARPGNTAAPAAVAARLSRSARPELLAPAGDWECVKAAVENGADAIYFGLDRFNARMRAQNFTEADLPRLMAFLHRRGVRGYVTFNTLVFTEELAAAESFLRTIIAAGVDAAIVQDVGVCCLIRRLSPDFPIHASTQMTITSAAGIAFARALGCSLVVLARECSLQEIARIQQAQHSAPTSTFPPPPIQRRPSTQPAPLKNRTSDLGLRTSNFELRISRCPSKSSSTAPCAWPTRANVSPAKPWAGARPIAANAPKPVAFPTTSVADGQAVALGDRRYLLSPQDLASVELLPELVRLGVRSLKIEGRLKSPDYVASITRIYREALDALFEEARSPKSEVRSPKSEVRGTRYEMEMAFSRGLYTGWFGGTNNQALVHARFPKKRGVFLGEVYRVVGDRVAVKLIGPLKPGDGVVFDASRPDEKEEGGRVYEIRDPTAEIRRALAESQSPKSEVRSPKSEAREVLLSFGRGDIDFRRIRAGDKLWKTSDPELERRLRQTFDGDAIRFRRPVDLEVHGEAGQPLTLIARDELGHVAQAQSVLPLVAAATQPLAETLLGEQLGRLGSTPFKLGRLVSRLVGDVMLPVSELNRLRREVAAELERQRSLPQRWTLNNGGVRNAQPGASDPGTAERLPAPNAAELIVLVRSLDQLQAALTAGVATLYCELEDPKRYRDAVQMAREQRITAHAAFPTQPSTPLDPRPSTLFVAPPRITKPGEEWILRQVRSSEADGYLVRNYDHLQCFGGSRCVGDYSLNVANPLSAEYFMARFGARAADGVL